MVDFSLLKQEKGLNTPNVERTNNFLAPDAPANTLPDSQPEGESLVALLRSQLVLSCLPSPRCKFDEDCVLKESVHCVVPNLVPQVREDGKDPRKTDVFMGFSTDLVMSKQLPLVHHDGQDPLVTVQKHIFFLLAHL